MKGIESAHYLFYNDEQQVLTKPLSSLKSSLKLHIITKHRVAVKASLIWHKKATSMTASKSVVNHSKASMLS